MTSSPELRSVSAGPLSEPESPNRSEKRPLRASEKALIALESLVSACGLGGGLYLASRPLTAMPLRFLDSTWFHTWRWPGLALLFFVGVCPALAAGAALRRMPVALIGHLGVGIGLIAWIVVEAAWIVVSPPLQIAMGLIGVCILGLGISELVGDHRTL